MTPVLKTTGLRVRAFTLLELLVVVALLALLLAMLLPAMAFTRPDSRMFQCRNNLRQLACAWSMYSGDNGDKLVSAYPGMGVTEPIPSNLAAWCYGSATSSGLVDGYWFSGTDPKGIRYGLLWPYVTQLRTYKCSADNRLAANGSGPILRSFSMNCYMNGRTYLDPGGEWNFQNGGNLNTVYRIFKKQMDISQPAMTWVLTEEDPESINDGMFLVSLFNPTLPDFPSRLHGKRFAMSFGDGHVGFYKFQTTVPDQWTVFNTSCTTYNADWLWVKDRTTVRR